MGAEIWHLSWKSAKPGIHLVNPISGFVILKVLVQESWCYLWCTHSSKNFKRSYYLNENKKILLHTHYLCRLNRRVEIWKGWNTGSRLVYPSAVLKCFSYQTSCWTRNRGLEQWMTSAFLLTGIFFSYTRIKEEWKHNHTYMFFVFS